MKIRKGKKSEWRVLHKILNDVPELQSSMDEDTYTQGWIKRVLSTKDNLVLIVEEKSEIAGFLIAHFLTGVRQTLINDVYVKPEYRGKGIGTKLIRECERISKKKGIIEIAGFVMPSNKNMIKLKKKLDYHRGNKFYVYNKYLIKEK